RWVLRPFFVSMKRHPPRPPLLPYTTLFRSGRDLGARRRARRRLLRQDVRREFPRPPAQRARRQRPRGRPLLARRHGDFRREKRRSEEHTSELQSRGHLVCRLLLEKKKSKRD